MQRTHFLVLVLALALTGAAVATIGAVGADTTQASNSTNTSNSSIGAGEQLSTILTTTDDDVRNEIDEAALEIEYERSDETERADTLADRAETLHERAEDVREEYEDLTEAYGDGDISQSEYAQQVAILNNRAANIQSNLDALANRTTAVSEFDLRAAGLEQETLDNVTQQLQSVSGTGPAMLLQQFTGQQSGEFEIEAENGVSIEVESEDGERSREIRRPDDGDESLTVNQSDAEATARAELSSQDGNWTMTEASVHEDSGYYEFEFEVEHPSLEGEAEIRVDGSSGDPIRIEEEIEPADEDDEDEDEREEEDEDETERDDDDEEDEDDRVDDTNIAQNVSVVATLDNGSVLVHLSYNEDPIANATVELNGENVGPTDQNGEAAGSITADSEEVELAIERGEFQAESTYAIQSGELIQTELDISFGDDEYESENELEDDQEEAGGDETDDDSEEENDATDDDEDDQVEDDADDGETDDDDSDDDDDDDDEGEIEDDDTEDTADDDTDDDDA
jgi:hypothetical protein